MRGSPSASNYPVRADTLSSSGYGTTRVNPGSIRWNAISSVTITGTTYQATCFWDNNGKLVIGKRVLDGAWTLYTQSSISISQVDNHNSCTLGIDPNGFIHICYDMHHVALNYAKSNAAIPTWTGTVSTGLSMLGTNEGSVTYPTFINDPAGNLYFLFRDGQAGNGDLYMYKYNHGATTWAGVAGTTAGKLIDGKTASPTRNAYWDHPCFDSNFGSGGYFHISFHWRVTGDASGANRDLCYARWDGTNWKKSDGTAQTVPITHANCEIVDNTSGANNGLTGLNGLYSDSNGHPHIAYPKTVGSFRQLMYAYHNGASWTLSQLTSGNHPNLNDDSDGIDFQTSIAIRRSDNTVFLFYLDNLAGGGVWMKSSSDFTNWTTKKVYPFIGFWTPKYDYVEFERSGNLYFSMEEYFGTLLAGLQTSFPIYVWKTSPSNLQ